MDPGGTRSERGLVALAHTFLDGLAAQLVGEVLDTLRLLASEGMTMICVTHEMRFAREVSDRAIFLHNGLVEEEGAPAQVFGDPKSERCRQFLAKLLH